MSCMTTFSGSSLRTRPVVASRTQRTCLVVEANKKVAKKQRVVFTQNLPSIGMLGEIKSVPVGFWRNYLQPRGMAKIASDGIMKQLKDEEEGGLKKLAEVKAKAQALANALSTIGKFTLKRKAGDKDQIYGSVTVADIVAAIYQQTGRDLGEYKFEVPEIKSIGTYEVSAQMHPEVKATFSVVVQKEKGAAPVAKAAAAKK
jgi:large subunit ribosomal protein L9